MLSHELVQKYTRQLQALNRSSSKTLGRAPHKPVLLLSVIQLIEKGEITSNRLFITPELLIAFKSNWRALVTSNHTPNFSLPFFHLNSEPFWRLIYNTNFYDSKEKISSLGKLKTRIAFAEIDKELFEILQNPITSTKIQNVLLDSYFPETRKFFKMGLAADYEIASEIRNQILNDSKKEYQSLMSEIEKNYSENEIEEERFIRGSIFKREVPKVYNNQCCISGMRIESSTNAQMIDACHIIHANQELRSCKKERNILLKIRLIV